MEKITLYCQYLFLNTNAIFRNKKRLFTTTLFSCAVLLAFNTQAQDIIGDYDFEPDEQGWSLGGDGGLEEDDQWSCSVIHSLYVKDDKSSSIVTSPALDISSYASISISFCYKAEGVDNGEGFYLKYYDGSSWTTLNYYERGVDFSNIGSSNNYSFSFTLLDTSYNFPTNAKFRFEGDASKGSEISYFDNVLIKEEPIFFDGDSDFDGVTDSVDIDDDNDGILDTDECDAIVNPPLSNADFEDLDIVSSGLDGGGTDVVGTSGIWKGDASNIPNWLSADTSNNYLEIWHNSQGAGNDAGGQAYSGTQWAEVNATTNDGLYQDVVSTPGDVLQWTFAHRKRTGYAGSSSEDIVRLMIGDPNGTMTSNGDFASAGDSSWTLHTGTYTVPAGQTTTRLTFTVLNSASGSTSSGNFIDNVQLFVIPSTCADTDGDSIPDYFDLDSDNDGIPDIVEAGFGSASAGTAKIPSGSFTDANGNGMHDAFENTSPLDSDNDGVPNFKDLDSDNDTVFDVDEARTARYVFSTLTFENGDGDINGDGVGDGLETEAFRAKDDDNDGNLEYFGDGILDIYDYGTGANEFGNLSQGSAPDYVADTDGDGIPDYIDTTSDGSTFDIANTHYADLDANNDGVIDDTNDSDGDGIVDLFDTNDSATGSPRDLQKKLDLFFDGRNDYVEDTNVMSGWSEATMMAWIKIDPSASGDQIIMGQDNFYIQLKSDLTIEAIGNNKNVSSNALSTNQWTHVAATYSNTNSKIKLYINGLEVDSYNVSGALPADASSLTLGRQPDTNSKYFNGYMDEARVFFKALTQNELQKMIYQEIEDNNGVIKGAIIPTDVTNFVDASTNTPLTWTNLKRYYRMDAFKDNVLDDLTTPEIDEGSGAKIYNTKVIAEQSAPLPFVTQQSGRLEVAVDDASNGINGDDAITANAIVKIVHDDVYIDSSLNAVALIIDEQDSGSNPIEFKVQNDSELNVSWYLKLDGKIDLEGESQLVQGEDSYLDPTSSGSLEKDQQGTADTYTYNYWSMPVGVTNNSTNNNNYTLPDVFDVNFLTSGYNGSASPVGIADYWIWKFTNKTSDDYSQWQHVRSTGTLKPGEGFTMKGPGTGSIATPQNYVLEGKPNNGDINLTINAGNDYLVGNPYASAIDAHQFILDNGAVISGTGATTGTLYFWEHWGGGSHYLSAYQGGYATYTLAGGVPAAAYGTNDPDVATGGTPTKTPGRYIPVGQGFFVTAEADGVVNFNNSQRVFQVEDNTNSVFTKSTKTKGNMTASKKVENQDTRLKLRIGFNSVNTIRRQLLATLDENGTSGYDWGFDAPYNDDQMDDMYWMINSEKYTVQATDEMNEQVVLPLGIHTKTSGVNSITLDKLENAPNSLKVYLHDKALSVYHDLNEGAYDVHLEAGEYLDRFEVSFSNQQALGIDDLDNDYLNVYLSNDKESVIINNPRSRFIQSTKMFNVLGQKVFESNMITNETNIELPAKEIKAGAYVIRLKTEEDTISKTVLVK
ncbi:MAG: T9SS type A sorting domain-containing protein [Flaviramulus sp.]|nr:LamG-like jellyroll fold domain-containing protein [Flaviramulus sp.]NNC49867.1 T9SS type A sorting domain-containing protein [Flaviramulus sp.]